VKRKLAVTLRGPLITREAGLVLPERAPDQLENRYPNDGCAVRLTEAPAL
jgi:hypothetical protein